MAKLEDITPGVSVKGLLPNGLATVTDVRWFGTSAIEVTYKNADGKLANELVYRDQENRFEIVKRGRAWSFDADPELLRLASEAYRIRLAHLFDPHVAIHTSTVTPLPHQILAVYGEMLKRQPLRYLLADDPGAGKTIMAGLLIKELIVRGDLNRCLIVCPGSLAEQWQDELRDKFGLRFEILTNDRIEASPSGNVFVDVPLMIARLDKLSRDEGLIERLRASDWDLIVCDEAHKMSATFFSGERKETLRYKLGKELSQRTRHFLLMSATPHNGKEEDFQLFMALIDGDRFEGRYREGAHVSDVSDMMRRMTKEDLLKFDGTPLFPERRAYTVTYPLSELEAALYEKVTTYVRDEFNRAEKLSGDGRKGTVGFALTILQRRLASSPFAIYQSLKRRRERLEAMLREEELMKHGRDVATSLNGRLAVTSWDDADDLEDVPGDEREEIEEEIVDQATAARTIDELRTEIATLKGLETLAHRVVASRTDRKWEELSKLIQNNEEMFDRGTARRRKLVIFTEMRDTLEYLSTNLRRLLGSEEAVVLIHGGLHREDRLNAQNQFKNLPEVEVLIATDAAGEGINLQQSHLMVNYDLPWNPNRLEQRFGRIHRIGQSEVCHLWNLVAENTREGEVYQTLLRKLEVERDALGGKVFDVLGKAIAGTELRNLMIDAVRYNDLPSVRARLSEVVAKLDTANLRQLLEDQALAHDSMDASKVREIREEMERAEAKKLQPFFIAQFFLKAFEHFGGAIRLREAGRYEIVNVPAVVRQRDRAIGRHAPLLKRYERICFDKNAINPAARSVAEFVCSGHPLLDCVIDLTIERYRDTLKQGAMLVDDVTGDEHPRVLVFLEHSIQDARTDLAGSRRVVSRRFEFVEIYSDGRVVAAGYAPYLNYRSPTAAETEGCRTVLAEEWLESDIEAKALEHAITSIVPAHLDELRANKEALIDKTVAAVKDRLTREIVYWDNRAEQLRTEEMAGKTNAKINSQKARQRAEELQIRLKRRTEELEHERRMSPLPPVVVGGALIIPKRLLSRLAGDVNDDAAMFARETKRVEDAAMQAVFEAERGLGNEPRDVSRDKCGWDIESRQRVSGKLRFIEVKGRIHGADTVTVTKNEILAGLNKREDFVLALVSVPKEEQGPEAKCGIRYVFSPFSQEPDLAVTSVNFALQHLWEKGSDPYEDR